MAYKREKLFLKILCRGYLEDLIREVGWTSLEQEIVRKKYIEHQEIADITFDLHISEATYNRYLDALCAKLQTYMRRHKDEDISLFY